MLLGCGMEFLLPMPLSGLVTLPGRLIIGWVAIVAGLAFLWWGLFTFKRHRTAVYPNQPARLVVCSGPYRFSRNPMYVGLTVITLGVSLLADNVWMLVLLPVVLILLTVFVIKREEVYLSEAFGGEYKSYTDRVRRWL